MPLTYPPDDTPTPARLIVRAWMVSEELVCVQFLTLRPDGDLTPAGLLSLPFEEWRLPCWARLRQVADYCDDVTASPSPNTPRQRWL